MKLQPQSQPSWWLGQTTIRVIFSLIMMSSLLLIRSSLRTIYLDNTDSYDHEYMQRSHHPVPLESKAIQKQTEVARTNISRIVVKHSTLSEADLRVMEAPFAIKPHPPPYFDNFKNPCWYCNVAQKVRCLPYAFVAGFPKCGTTDLHQKIKSHPDVVHSTKEIHWLTRHRFSEDRGYLNFYLNQLEPGTLEIAEAAEMEEYHDKIMIDSSASTVWDNELIYPEELDSDHPEPEYLNAHYFHTLIPDAKFIFIIRNPTTRMYSDYLFLHKKSGKVTEFHSNIVAGIDAFEECIQDPKNSLKFCVYHKDRAMRRLRIGIYHVPIADYLSVYDRKQILIIRLEDYARYKLTVLKQVYSFLGLHEYSEEEIEEFLKERTRNQNTAGYATLGPMLNETRTLLDEFYRPHNEKLAKLMGDHKFAYQ